MRLVIEQRIPGKLFVVVHSFFLQDFGMFVDTVSSAPRQLLERRTFWVRGSVLQHGKVGMLRQRDPPAAARVPLAARGKARPKSPDDTTLLRPPPD